MASCVHVTNKAESAAWYSALAVIFHHDGASHNFIGFRFKVAQCILVLPTGNKESGASDLRVGRTINKRFVLAVAVSLDNTSFD